MSETTGPMSAQIAAVQQNLAAMQAFNDYVYNEGAESRITNCYYLLNQNSSNDPGVQFGVNMLMKTFNTLVSDATAECAFAAAATAPQPIVGTAMTFLVGMLGSWSAAPPAPLDDTFASVTLRVQGTNEQVDAQLYTYYSDVAANWDVSFTANGQTVALFDLADDGTFPVETDTAFNPLAQQAIFALDQFIWQYVLDGAFYCT